MARIRNLDLDIKKGRTVSTVIVTYEVCFTSCEVKAGFYFSDHADIYGSDVGPDDRLFRVGRTSCYKATKKCQQRKYSRTLQNQVLDEDKPTLWPPNFDDRDEVYAEACVRPIEPVGACARSTIHHDFF